MKTITEMQLAILETCNQQLKTTSCGALVVQALAGRAMDAGDAGRALAELFSQIAGNVAQMIAGDHDELADRLWRISQQGDMVISTAGQLQAIANELRE